MKLGYTDFINSHKHFFVFAFIAFFLIYLICPTIYVDLSNHPDAIIRDGTQLTFSPIYLCIRSFKINSYIYSAYTNSEYAQHFNITYHEFRASAMKDYADGIIALIFTILILASLIYVLIHFIKTKSISRFILIPFCLAIISDIAVCITYGILEPLLTIIPINFIITLLISIPVFLYCAGFQRFPTRKPREHKPTDKERIAELERQVAELQKEKDT